MLGNARLCLDTISCSDFSTCQRDGHLSGGTVPTHPALRGTPGLSFAGALIQVRALLEQRKVPQPRAEPGSGCGSQ